jgi:hypothetical protein
MSYPVLNLLIGKTMILPIIWNKSSLKIYRPATLLKPGPWEFSQFSYMTGIFPYLYHNRLGTAVAAHWSSQFPLAPTDLLLQARLYLGDSDNSPKRMNICSVIHDDKSRQTKGAGTYKIIPRCRSPELQNLPSKINV